MLFKKEYVYFILFIVLFGILQTFKPESLTIPFFLDEITTYLNPSLALLSEGVGLINPFQYSFEKMYGHPPGIPLAFSFIFKAIDLNIENIRVINLFISLSSVLLVYSYFAFIRKKILAGIIAGLLLLTHISFLPNSHAILGDHFFNLFFVLFIFTREMKLTKFSLLVGLLLPWIRESAAFFALAIFLFWSFEILKSRRVLRDFLKSCDFGLCVSTFTYFSWIYIGSGSFAPVYFDLGNDILSLDQMIKEFISINGAVYLKSGILGIFLLCIFIDRSKKNEIKGLSLWYFFVSSCFLVSFVAPLYRYHLSIITLILIYCSSILAEALRKLRNKRKEMVLAISGFVFILFSSTVQSINEYKYGQQGYYKIKDFLSIPKLMEKHNINQDIIAANHIFNFLSSDYMKMIEGMPHHQNNYQNIYPLDFSPKEELIFKSKYMITIRRNGWEQWLGHHQNLFKSFSLFERIKGTKYEFLIYKRQ